MSHYHIIGRRIEGVLYRYDRVLTDQEFYAVLEELGGYLPSGYVAWHMEKGKNIRNSSYARTIAERPILKRGLMLVDPILDLQRNLEVVPRYVLCLHSEQKTYIVLMQSEVIASRSMLDEHGFTERIMNQPNREAAERLGKEIYRYRPVVLELKPISYREACAFIQKHHRHLDHPQGQKTAVGLTDGKQLVGAAIAGLPTARMNHDGYTLEVTRNCVLPIFKNGCSLLYGAIKKYAKSLGYHRVITYTLEDETGSSLMASGFKPMGSTTGGSWDRPSRQRINRHPQGPKKRWEYDLQPGRKKDDVRKGEESYAISV